VHLCQKFGRIGRDVQIHVMESSYIEVTQSLGSATMSPSNSLWHEVGNTYADGLCGPVLALSRGLGALPTGTLHLNLMSRQRKEKN
jgi:hypothetical protein